MPFQFTLPTTSTFSFSTYLESPTHPSLPIAANTHRATVRSSLKSHKRLSKSAQVANLPHLIQVFETYTSYLFTLDAGLSGKDNIDVVLKTNPRFSWRPTISASSIPGREQPRVMLNSLEYEIYFVLATLSYTHTLRARSLLSPLNSTSTESPTSEARTSAIQTATKHLLLSASIHALLASRSETLSTTTPTTPPCVDISPPILRALSHLAHAEATLLAVAKDDPYPSAAAQTVSSTDKEWMIRAPSIPKVRAHLYARLCLAGSQHASTAHDLLKGDGGGKVGRVEEALVGYADEISRVGKARACRFLGVDRDAENGTGEAIAWIRAALHQLGLRSEFEDETSGGEKKSRLGFSRVKSAIKDKEIGKGEGELADEARVLRALEKKWMKENDTIMTQPVPEWMPLLAQLPSGRDIYSVKPWEPPRLAPGVLASLRAPMEEGVGDQGSDSEDEMERSVPGAFGGGGGAYY